jgi:hypothetical protein
MNGLIGDIDNETNTTFSFMAQNQGDVNMFSNYASNSVKGIIEETPLSELFFSKMNIDVNQLHIRYKMYEKYNENKEDKGKIDEQSYNELFIVMRSIFLQYANTGIGSYGVTNEIKRLNEKVVSFCFEQVEVQYLQYHDYKKKLKSLYVPNDIPQVANKKNFTYDVSNLLNDNGDNWLSDRKFTSSLDDAGTIYRAVSDTN